MPHQIQVTSAPGCGVNLAAAPAAPAPAPAAPAAAAPAARDASRLWHGVGVTAPRGGRKPRPLEATWHT